MSNEQIIIDLLYNIQGKLNMLEEKINNQGIAIGVNTEGIVNNQHVIIDMINKDK